MLMLYLKQNTKKGTSNRLHIKSTQAVGLVSNRDHRRHNQVLKDKISQRHDLETVRHDSRA